MRKKKYITPEEREQRRLDIVEGVSFAVCAVMIMAVSIMAMCLIAKVVIGV